METWRLLEMEQLASYSDSHAIKIHDIVDLAAKHWNAIHGHGMKDGWMVGQDDELLF